MAQFLQMHRKNVLEVRGGESQKIMDYDYDFRWSDFNFRAFFFPLAIFFVVARLTADLPPIQSVKRRWKKEMTRYLLKLEG